MAEMGSVKNTKRKRYLLKKPWILWLVFLTCVLAAGAGCYSFVQYASSFSAPTPAVLDQDQQDWLKKACGGARSRSILSPISYAYVQPQLDIAAHCALLLDANTGSILYEKNADDLVPPASMTKLVVMSLVLQEIAEGRVSFSDVVPLPPECWARNLPSDASLMFLGEGQTVTLEELLTGMAVVSGNDAAIAVACFISGSVEEFVKRMNDEMTKLGLVYTRFVEPSGYSERNQTTAREFAAFCRNYVQRYGQVLEKFHAVREFTYPQEKNLPVPRTSAEVRLGTVPVKQKATNPVLDEIPGADGLKTGFINESGYNLALTVCRNGVRYLLVTMKGPGKNKAEGNYYRLKDSKEMMEWAFANMESRKIEEPVRLPAVVYQGKENSLFLVDAYAMEKSYFLTVPKDGEAFSYTIEEVGILRAPIQAGDTFGKIVYQQGGLVIAEVPLVADRTIKQGWIIKRWIDGLLLK